MSETPHNPTPHEEPEASYDAAYAERYGLPKPEYEVPLPEPKEQTGPPPEVADAYEQRRKAVDIAQKAMELAEPGAAKRQATLRLEAMQDEFDRYVEAHGTPESPPKPDGKP